jgi:hypothetical protein
LYHVRIASKFEVRKTKCANKAGETASGFTGSRGVRIISGVASITCPPGCQINTRCDRTNGGGAAPSFANAYAEALISNVGDAVAHRKQIPEQPLERLASVHRPPAIHLEQTIDPTRALRQRMCGVVAKSGTQHIGNLLAPRHPSVQVPPGQREAFLIHGDIAARHTTRGASSGWSEMATIP